MPARRQYSGRLLIETCHRPLGDERPDLFPFPEVQSQHRMRTFSNGCWYRLAISRLTGALAACAVASMCGCGPSVSAVSGVVTLDGNPLPNARVILTPVGGSGRPAHATTDEAGKFTVTSIKPGDGAYRGEYK